LLAADERGDLRMAYCLTNAAESATTFRVDPIEHFRAQQHAERNGWVIAGAFHSHPRSEAAPSATDVAGALDPEWVYVIAGPVDTDEVPVNVFRIIDGTSMPIGLDVAVAS
jgi:proteasome lid subunit RPN8/RPN11